MNTDELTQNSPPEETKNPTEETSTTQEKNTKNPDDVKSANKPKGFNDRLKSGAKSAGKAGLNASKNQVVGQMTKSDGVVGAVTRGAIKAKKAFMNAKKYTGWIVKYVQFCISSPLGWIVGIITIAVLGGTIMSISNSVQEAASEMDSALETSVETSNDVETTILLMDCKDNSTSTNLTGELSSADASESDWLKEGTRAYKNAKDIFDAWTNAGLSGTAAAGLLGWVETEGGFDIIGRAEGYYGGKIEENSIKYGVVPIPSQSHYSVGGGGVYQFTPYTKYAPLSDAKWEDGKAMTEYVISVVANDWIPNPNDLTGGNHTFEQFAQETDPAQAALMWNSYERGHRETIMKVVPHKQESARKANEVFNKDNIQFDKAKFEKNFGAGSSGSTDESTTSTTESKTKCGPTESGGTGWSVKGGKHSYSSGMRFHHDQVPADLKQYALNPESVGLKWGDTSTWKRAYDFANCTDFTASLGYWLWEKDGKHPTQLRGHGSAVANNWAATYGGSTTKTPSSGAIFSSPGTTSNAYGHTGIVSHVFEDGSILYLEQNCIGYSGAVNGMKASWNYGIISKAALEAEGWTFYNPGDNGFSVNASARSL